jgi:hypothetical protein
MADRTRKIARPTPKPSNTTSITIASRRSRADMPAMKLRISDAIY